MKLGPTFSEMGDPKTMDRAVREKALAARAADPLDPINLYNITWHGPAEEINAFAVPEELTGVDSPIVVIYSREFPTGSHKVGAAYPVLAEMIVTPSRQLEPRPF